METIHINLWGGPCVGKSKMASNLFSELKSRGINCELVREYAKELVWEESFNKLDNQILVFANQHHRHKILDGKVEIVITDSPIPMGCVYDKGTKFLDDLAISEFNKFKNKNFFLKRIYDYQETGRMQTEDEAIEKDGEIKTLLGKWNIPYIEVDSIDDIIDNIYDF